VSGHDATTPAWAALIAAMAVALSWLYFDSVVEANLKVLDLWSLADDGAGHRRRRAHCATSRRRCRGQGGVVVLSTDVDDECGRSWAFSPCAARSAMTSYASAMSIVPSKGQERHEKRCGLRLCLGFRTASGYPREQARDIDRSHLVGQVRGTSSMVGLVACATVVPHQI
jgi:hypothetical protein